MIGASHQRKGKPCQDASLSRSLLSKGGEELQLMVVSDGHGGERYWLSDVGSRLACQEAANAVAAAAIQNSLDDQFHWQHLLAEELPKAIHSKWLESIRQDWQNQPNIVEQDFSPQLYGCTVGLVLMAPQWWGYTGLGDWDLVVIQDGTAELVSEEKELNAAGEATASLSMADAFEQFKPRCSLRPLEQSYGRMQLLMSTDGIRKSCATDEDFRSLCIHLAQLNKAEEIGEALAEITSQGSGDDVSVVIGKAIGNESDNVDNSQDSSSEACAHALASNRAKNSLKYKGIWAAVALVGFALLAWKIFSVQKNGTSLTARETDMRDIKAAASSLCTNPPWLDQALDQNQKVFDQLSNSNKNPRVLINEFKKNRISALIAYSRVKPDSKESLDLEALDAINSCPELKQALERRWKVAKKESAPAQIP